MARSSARKAVHSRSVAEDVGGAAFDLGVSTAIGFAESEGGVPRAVAILVTIAACWLVVAVFALGDAVLRRVAGSDGAVRIGGALVHVDDGFARIIADARSCSPLAILEVVAGLGSHGAVGAASLAAESIGAESAHCLRAALRDREGVVAIDVDVGAGGGAGQKGGIEHAARIGNAGFLVAVHDGAVADAAEGGGVPGAERRADAIVRIVDGEAADAADGGLGIPFAVAVRVALIG